MVFLIARRDGAAVGCGALRRLDERSVEVKRMYVVPEARGSGAAKALLDALHAEARAAGCTRARLETGPAQPEAIRFYEREGYEPVPCWGAYAGQPDSVCFGRELA